MIGAAEGFGGKVMRTISFFRLFFESSSSSPNPAATIGPRGGRGGGLLACGFGFGFSSSGMVNVRWRLTSELRHSRGNGTSPEIIVF